MANWFHRFLNPHCQHCADERRENRVCNSCDILEKEVARLRHENEKLLDRLLEKPEPEPERTVAPTPTAVLPKRVPWAVRQQQLEIKDREKAQEMKLRANAPKPDITELEKELEVVSSEREAQSGT